MTEQEFSNNLTTILNACDGMNEEELQIVQNEINDLLVDQIQAARLAFLDATITDHQRALYYAETGQLPDDEAGTN